MGDPAGIGGEIILKALPFLTHKSIPVVIGDRSVLDAFTDQHTRSSSAIAFHGFGEGHRGNAELIDLGLVKKPKFGIVDPVCGSASYEYIVEALKRIFLGEIDALVTCPINKASIARAGITFPGHTELLAHFAGVTDYVMMMANRRMRVSLATIHIPLKEVPGRISPESVFSTITITHRSLKSLWKIDNPVLKVCGINPHAGEHGIMGSEEDRIREAIATAQALGISVHGPFPADTLFHSVDCDSYVAMYHDQGLIPVKTVDFGRTVNITLGLPFVRTSPGHGTGYDIAGKGLASPSALIEAYRTAEAMCTKNS